MQVVLDYVFLMKIISNITECYCLPVILIFFYLIPVSFLDALSHKLRLLLTFKGVPAEMNLNFRFPN